MTAATPTREPISRNPRAAHSPRTLRSDLEAVRARISAAIAERPIAATAAAAGVGFALGGGLTFSTMALLARVGARAAVAWAGNSIRATAFEHLGAAPKRRETSQTNDDRTGGT